ncbi:MAG TPA: T9SS type A sorting domain-containing protein [Candidatus Kapabacteria bacterium]|nr:T9SS type A sorting domain-containing protein [Candidatus Kapabacteria bacterium]
MRSLLRVCLFFLSLISSQVYAQGFSHEESYVNLSLWHTVDLGRTQEPQGFTSQEFHVPKPGGGNTNEIKAALMKQRAERLQNVSRPFAANVPLLDRNFQANNASGTPNDNSMAISNAGIVVSVVNTNVRIYDSTGKQLLSRSLATFGDTVGPLTRTYDPRALYDPISDRFIVVFLNGTLDTNNNPIVCFSKTNDPTKDWNVYKLPGNPLQNDTTWSDYPIVSMSKDELFLTFNLLKNNMNWDDGFTRSLIWQVPKNDGYTGATALTSKLYSEIKYDGRYVWSICPVRGSDQIQSPNMYFLSVRPDAESNDMIFLHEVTNTAASGTATLLQKLLVTNVKYGVPPNADQPKVNDTIGNYLQTNDARVLDATLRDNTIHFVGNTVDPTNLRAALHIGRITDPSGPNAMATGQIYSDPALDFGYPSIVALPQGLVMTFSHTSSTVFPGTSAAYLPSLGEYVDRIVVKDGSSAINVLQDSIERWGDYTGLQVRYNNPSTAWLSGSYGVRVGISRTHQTWVGEVRIAPSSVPERPTLELSRSLSYPNPTNGLVNVASTKPLRTVSFVNALGARIELMPFATGEGFAVDLSDQPAGMYHITLHYADGSEETQKIVLDR